MTQHKIIGIDLAKNIFFLFEINHKGRNLSRKKLPRSKLLDYIAAQTLCIIAMEACSGAHYWAREFEKFGHKLLLYPPQHVKNQRRKQKNDYNDAEAIAELALYQRNYTVPHKSIEQQDIQSLIRMRRLCVTERTRLINQVRGLLAEYGIVISKGKASFRQTIPEIMENSENLLSPTLRELLAHQYERYLYIDEQIQWFDEKLNQTVKQFDNAKRLMSIPGFGPLTSQAVAVWLGSGQQFKTGRDASAAMGLVPKQDTTGGNVTLLGITKQGNTYIRSLLVHGARAALRRAKFKSDKLSKWMLDIQERRGANRAAVALANKFMRIAWAVTTKKEEYQPA
ncbi:COG3547 Transposase and inactivated derivatives [Vibrio sp. B1FLJ16]|uniref:IS110 family transposase n=1 Tax=Vibrio sp. B1FLJ16 TaxID=2751178 RepID=UPI0015F77E38|nr:IS110 family transposase [Vibrio sp. B1FLJ16]CAD7824308.1 COG3547 Transposase and inactivated derivatives [Vibrio sp. B1FLJ16]CAE6954172.1 COG3547 Transposase and inactivated derivatives [Vibrio sp. B1FLJ16]